MPPGQESRQSVDGGQAHVARRDAVVPLGFQMSKEVFDCGGIKIRQVEHLDAAATPLSDELQQHHDRIAIAADRVSAHFALRRQVRLEELHH